MKVNTMNRICKTFNFVAYLALLTALPAFTQIPSNEANLAGTTSGPVAWVYVQTNKGVNVYDAASHGKLTLVNGSPFNTTGAMAGSNGSHLITLGTDLVHSYAVETNGAIGKQLSEISTQDYDGSQCGNNTGGSAVLDHTGQNLYAMLINSNCMAQQTFEIEKGSGRLAFGGAAVDTAFPADALADDDCCTRLTITGNDVFGYTVSEQGPFWNSSLTGFRSVCRLT